MTIKTVTGTLFAIALLAGTAHADHLRVSFTQVYVSDQVYLSGAVYAIGDGTIANLTTGEQLPLTPDGWFRGAVEVLGADVEGPTMDCASRILYASYYGPMPFTLDVDGTVEDIAFGRAAHYRVVHAQACTVQ